MKSFAICCLTLAISMSGAYSQDAATVQQTLLRDQTHEQAMEARVSSTKAALQQHMIDLTYRLFSEERASGLKLDDPKTGFDELNGNLRNQRVPEYVIEKSADQGRFILISSMWSSEKPVFAVAGYGLITGGGSLKDDHFEEAGAFGLGCKYEVPLEDWSKAYDCAPFIKGRLDNQIVADMKNALVDAIKAKSGAH